MGATGESSTVTSRQYVGLLVGLSARAKCKTFFQLAVDNGQSAGQLEAMESRRRCVRQVRDGNFLNGHIAAVRLSGMLTAVATRIACSVNIRGKSRMREIRTYGSVRGAAGNGGPYREALFPFAASLRAATNPDIALPRST